MKANYIKHHMYTDVDKFVNNIIKRNHTLYLIFKFIHIFLNILIIAGSFATVTLSTIIISKLVFYGFPEWFYYVTTSIAASTTFVGLMMNLLLVHKTMIKSKYIIIKINAQLILYSESIGEYSTIQRNKKIILFDNVTRIIEYKISIKSRQNEI